MLLVLIATFGNAYAADWRPLPIPTANASLQAQQDPEGAGVPRIINGTPTADFPAVAALVITVLGGSSLPNGNERAVAGCLLLLVAISALLIR